MVEPVVSMELTFVRHDDGCTILSARLSTPQSAHDLYETYAAGTELQLILRALAFYVSLVESGEIDEELLWEALALPFHPLES